MTNEKKKKLIVAGTAGAVLFLAILLFIMVFQLVAIQNKRNDITILKAIIAEYEQKKAEANDTVEVISMREWIEREARRLNYYYPIK